MIPPPTPEMMFNELMKRLIAQYRISPEDDQSMWRGFRASIEFALSLGSASRHREVLDLKDALLTCKRVLESADQELIRKLPDVELQRDGFSTPLLIYVDMQLCEAEKGAAGALPYPKPQANGGITQWLQRRLKSVRRTHVIPPPAPEILFSNLIERIIAQYRLSPEDSDEIRWRVRSSIEIQQSMGSRSRDWEVGELKNGLLACKRVLESADKERVCKLPNALLGLWQYVDMKLREAEEAATGALPHPKPQARGALRSG
jgi:hypothetical protein